MRTGALATLAAGFFASALLRTGEVVAALPLAEGAGLPAAASTSAAADVEAEGRRLVGLAAELAEQRAELDRREAALVEREQLLAAMEERVRARLAELEAARQALRETVELADGAARRDIRRLTAMYQQMKPKRAGQIFNAMEPRFAAGFLGEMEPSAAALILANMDPARAYAVTVLLAGRNVERDADGASPAGHDPGADAEPQAEADGAARGTQGGVAARGHDGGGTISASPEPGHADTGRAPRADRGDLIGGVEAADAPSGQAPRTAATQPGGGGAE